MGTRYFGGGCISPRNLAYDHPLSEVRPAFRESYRVEIRSFHDIAKLGKGFKDKIRPKPVGIPMSSKPGQKSSDSKAGWHSSLVNTCANLRAHSKSCSLVKTKTSNLELPIAAQSLREDAEQLLTTYSLIPISQQDISTEVVRSKDVPTSVIGSSLALGPCRLIIRLPNICTTINA